ncbi:hypothetical protein L1987_64977 [Smallanthus sonchifolius]|uniref:Uncharacterized protein n=1 Tax=Smallanthus sonchifolius TaxID=185202 RepID=A0ACB9BTF2_9ASTR|nr:hypothetical protein L1987_64977 [Smallanthus sonchifolius]
MDSQTIRETSLEVPLLGSGSHLGSIEQPSKPFHYFSSLNLSAEAPSQDDMPSPTTTISEVLIDLAANVPSPSSSPKKVHSRSDDSVNVERAITTTGTSIDKEDSDNITKSPTTTTHNEDVFLETLFTKRNPRCQENQGDGDPEARPKAPSSSKDSTTVDKDRLKLENMELMARVEMLEAEVSKLKHQVSMHEVHKCAPVTTPSIVSVGPQTDETLCTDATKKGEIVTAEDDVDSLDSVDEEEDISEDWKLGFRAVDENPKYNSILSWGYDGLSERFWIRWESGKIEELIWNTLNPFHILDLYLTKCINNSTDLPTEHAIGRFYDLMEDNMPWFEWFLQEATKLAYPSTAESSRTAEHRLAPRLDLIGSRALTEEQVLCLRRFFYNEVDTHLHHQLLRSQAMIKIIKAFLEKEGWIAMDDSDSDLSLPSSPTVILNAAVESRKMAAQNVNEAFKATYKNEWKKEESEAVPSIFSAPQIANEAEAEISTASLTFAIVINEAKAEAFNKDKGKGIITEEEEEKIEKEKKEK